MCFSSIISTNLAISGGNFAKILTSQIWIKKMLTGSFPLLYFSYTDTNISLLAITHILMHWH
jgi:hypothetical protein